jgi:signal transduction histidine kinase
VRSPSADLRFHARRVALVATAIAAAIYVLACLVVNLMAEHRIDTAIDTRVTERLHEVAVLRPESTPGRHISAGRGDLDDAPVLVWWVPAGKSAVPLTPSTPALPRSAWGARALGMTMIGTQHFRVAGEVVPGGALVAATSTHGESSIINTLLVTEAVLLPILGLAVYAAALAVGRSAAGPIERSRQRQLAFTADASHELRTPISVLEAEVSLALSGDRPSADYRRALERVADEGGRLRHIVDDLLFLARFDSEPAAIDEGAVDLASVAEVCVERFAALAQARHQHLDWSALGWSSERDEGPAVAVPGAWLDRLCGVLVDNACRYTPAGGKVEVSVEQRGGDAVLIVDDSGPGIPPEQREEIFARFRRASSVPGGAGLGLAIAAAIVHSSHGRLSVEQSPLGGARMRVSWPAAKE